jgi:hypothetical protein
VRLTADGVVKIVDLGCSWIMCDYDFMMESLYFIAPELMLAGLHRSTGGTSHNMFSLGILLYQVGHSTANARLRF